jgi:DNA-binding protein HU-beta
MNKGHLIERVAKETGLSKVAADKVIDSVLASVSDGLRQGERVTFVGFGTFSITQRRARTGRNPQTGAPIKIAAKKAVRFATGKKLSDAINRSSKK